MRKIYRNLLVRAFNEGFRKGSSFSPPPSSSLLEPSPTPPPSSVSLSPAVSPLPSISEFSSFSFPGGLLRRAGIYDHAFRSDLGRQLRSKARAAAHPDVYRTVPESIRATGFPVEVHHITTEDGYVLEFHRIPGGRNGSGSTGERPPVLLVHCILCSSAVWIQNPPDKGLAYRLADSGYDVWMLNVRGNRYSRQHVSLTTEDEQYWDFSWQDMARYDLPSAIDYVLSTTNQKNLYYVGYSMGTSVFFATMSEFTEYNKKIRVMVALGPVAESLYVRGTLAALANFSDLLEGLASALDLHEPFPEDELLDAAYHVLCRKGSLTAPFCYSIFSIIAGPNPDQLNEDYFPVILAHTPAGTSLRTITHFGQLANTGRFGKYDYGPEGNLEHYGTTTAPLFDLSKVTAPVALFWGERDWLATPKDAEMLSRRLPNVISSFRIPGFTHLDFPWGIDADTLVYRHVIDVLGQY